MPENAVKHHMQNHTRPESFDLQKNPLCVKCRANGRLEPAIVIDHIVLHRGDPKLFWDQNNWQSLCKTCHDKKTGSGL